MSDGKRKIEGEEHFLLGIILGAYGIKGWVRVKSFAENLVNFSSYGALKDQAGHLFYLNLVKADIPNPVFSIKGVKSREEAEALKGCKLYIPRTSLPSLDDPDNFYSQDLVGLRVFLLNGELYGSIIQIMNYGAGDIVEIETKEKDTISLPFTRQIFPFLYLNEGKVTIDLPEWR